MQHKRRLVWFNGNCYRRVLRDFFMVEGSQYARCVIDGREYTAVYDPETTTWTASRYL